MNNTKPPEPQQIPDGKGTIVNIPEHDLPQELQLVFLASAARTGSSHVVELAHSSSVFDGIEELFNNHFCEWMNDEACHYLESVNLPNDRSDKSLINAIRTDPVRALRFASHARQKNRAAALVKLMPECPKTIYLQDLIAIQNLHSIVFTSRPMIDALISQVKASTSRIWQYQDTTENQIDFNVNILSSHYEVVSNWYRKVRDLANAAKVPMGLLEYEADIKQAPRFTLGRFFAEAQMETQNIHETKSGMVIQDRNTDWRKKVKNPEEIEAQIRRLGLEEAYFETFPKRNFITQSV